MAHVNIPASTGNISINVPSSQGRIDISTTSKNDTTKVSLQDVQSFAVNKAKDWAEKMDGPIGSEGYSAKWHATEASKSAIEAQSFAEQAEALEASIDSVVANATTEINAVKDSVLQDENIIAIKDNLGNIATTAVNIEDINTNAENIEAIKDTAVLLEHIEKKSMPVGTIFQAIRTDIPEGSLRLDGTEFTTGFEGFVTNYLATGKIISKSLEEWQTEYTMTNGNVGFFGYDEATGKFKTPCIQAGTFLAQAVLAGEFGSFLASSLKSHTHSWSGTTSSTGAHTHTRGTMNITGAISYHSWHNVSSGAFYADANVDWAKKAGTGTDNNSPVSGATFDASRSWTGATSSNGAHTHTVSGTTGGTGGSDTYPKHIRYPFFVVVSNVAAEEPSQVAWDNFVGNLDSKANKSLNNLDEQGEKHFLNKQQITNCLLEVPQNIKLELKDGVLTLKAGSKVIVPNGFEADGTTPKFDEVVTTKDFSINTTYNDTRALCVKSNLNGVDALPIDICCYSGSTAPTNYQWMFWYDTTNNKMKYTSDNGTTWVDGFSLPVCIFSGTNVPTRIDQIFNGMGYIGSTVWVDKGVKGLTPYYRNEDGTLKNIEFETNKVLTVTAPKDTQHIRLNENTLQVGNLTYDETKNINTLNGAFRGFAVVGTVTGDSNNIVTSLDIKRPFRAVDGQDVIKKTGGTMTGDLTGISSPYPFIAQSNGMDITTTPTGNQFIGYDFRDKNGTRVGWCGVVNNANGTKYFQIQNISGVDGFMFPKCTTKATTTSSASSSKVAVIVQNYVNGTSWYRVWSDGWIEQGGTHSSGEAVKISLMKNFSNTNYNIQLTGEGSQSAHTPLYYSKTTSSFTVRSAAAGTLAGNWYACGY
jgi:hypothetical protein